MFEDAGLSLAGRRRGLCVDRLSNGLRIVAAIAVHVGRQRERVVVAVLGPRCFCGLRIEREILHVLQASQRPTFQVCGSGIVPVQLWLLEVPTCFEQAQITLVQAIAEGDDRLPGLPLAQVLGAVR